MGVEIVPFRPHLQESLIMRRPVARTLEASSWAMFTRCCIPVHVHKILWPQYMISSILALPFFGTVCPTPHPAKKNLRSSYSSVAIYIIIHFVHVELHVRLLDWPDLSGSATG